MAEQTDHPAPAREAGLAERLLLGLHAALPAALLAIALVQLLPPPRGSAPAQQPAWLAWGAIGLWLPPALLAAVVLRRRLQMWRAALSATAVLLLGCGAAGLALHTAQALPFALALALLAAACAALAAAIGPHRLREHRRAPGPAPPRPPPSPPLWRRLLTGLPFWSAAILMLEGFRLAHTVAHEAQRGAGMVGMLLAFFLLLPAATLAPWLPRTAAALAGGAAAGFAWLAQHSALAPWWLGVALSVAVAVQVLRRTAVRAGGGRQ